MNFVTITFFKRPLGIAFLASMLLNPAASGEPETGWAGKDFGKVPSPVNPGAVTIEGKTEIKWMPEAFKFTPGASVRYVVFKTVMTRTRAHPRSSLGNIILGTRGRLARRLMEMETTLMFSKAEWYIVAIWSPGSPEPRPSRSVCSSISKAGS